MITFGTNSPGRTAARRPGDPMTAKQAAVLQFLLGYLLRHGIPPTIQAYREGLGLRSPNAVAGHLRALKAKGYIRKAGGIGGANAGHYVPVVPAGCCTACGQAVEPPARAPGPAAAAGDDSARQDDDVR